ncbi:hypothetical protein CDL15_Pgr010876 [Punica granatum]|uniref:Uncharacterized protein n=1 Tax=Punica granatum TaxID=22663 RepID=A0A218W619_PUNGR|nr:hypothetical protein CDL15_Pgr010876 [Punica granatum]
MYNCNNQWDPLVEEVWYPGAAVRNWKSLMFVVLACSWGPELVLKFVLILNIEASSAAEDHPSPSKSWRRNRWQGPSQPNWKIFVR